MSFFKLKSGF